MASWDWFQKHQLEQQIKRAQQQETRLQSSSPSRQGSPLFQQHQYHSHQQQQQQYHYQERTSTPDSLSYQPMNIPSLIVDDDEDDVQLQQQQQQQLRELVANQSQDYIDEKEMEYRGVIQHLADEQERVQKKVFMNWINHYVPNCIQADIIGELRDGTKLIALIEALTGEKLHAERGKRLRRPHFISNVNTVLQFLEKRKVKLVNIHATDIVDGNPCIILGLIWTIILHFHIEEYFRLAALEQQNEASSPIPFQRSSPIPSASSKPMSDKPLSSSAVQKSSVRKTLLDSLNKRFGLCVSDFGNSWRDGNAFLTLIDGLMPQLRAREKGRSIITNRARLQLAFDLAEQHLGISKLLDPEDIDVPRPDERSIMTYVSQFLHKPAFKAVEKSRFPSTSTSAPATTAAPCSSSTSSSLPNEEAESLKRWISHVTSTGITALNIDRLKSEFLKHRQNYEKLKRHLDFETQRKWNLIESELELGKQIIDWLSIAEELLRSYSIPTSGEQVDEQLRRHRLFFSSLPKLDDSSQLLATVKKDYNESLRLANEWQTAMNEASKRWAKYHEAVERLKNWLSVAEEKLQKTHEPHLNPEDQLKDLNDLKRFFGNKAQNELILSQFITTCDDVLATLPETHQSLLRETLKGLEARFHDITNYKAPNHLIRFEFDLTETRFSGNMSKIPPDEDAVLDDLNLMENLGTSLWKRFNDKSLLERAMANRREWDKRRKQPTTEIGVVRQKTIEMIKESELNVKSITRSTHIEVIRHNEEILMRIRNQIEELRRLSSSSNINIQKELKDIEEKLERLIELLKAKKKEKVITWLEEEVPVKLSQVKSDNDVRAIRKDITQYRELIDETELIRRVDVLNVQTKLMEIEKTKVESIPEAKSKLKELKQAPVLTKEVETQVNLLESGLVREWEMVEERKDCLQSWLTSKPENVDIEAVKEKETEATKLIERLEKNEVIQKYASDLAVNTLKDQLVDLQKEYKNLSTKIRRQSQDLTNIMDTIAKRQKLIERITIIEAWLIENHVEKLLCDDEDDVEEAVKKLKKKKAEHEKQKNELLEIYNELKLLETDEEVLRRYSNVSLQIESYLWDTIMENQREKCKTAAKVKERKKKTKERVAKINRLLDETTAEIENLEMNAESVEEKQEQLKTAKEIQTRLEEIPVEAVAAERETDEYRSLVQKVETVRQKAVKLLKEKEKAYNEHLVFKETCENFELWLETLKQELVSSETPETINALAAQKSVGDNKLAAIRNLGLIAEERSSQSLKRVVNQRIDALEKDHCAFFAKVQEMVVAEQEKVMKAKIAEEKAAVQEQLVAAKLKTEYEEISEYLQNVEKEVKDLPLKDSLRQKVNQCKQLQELQENLIGKEDTIRQLIGRAASEENPQITGNIGDIDFDYKILLNAVRDQLIKRKEYVANHQKLEKLLSEALAVNKKTEETLAQVHDLESLKEQVDLLSEMKDNKEHEALFRQLSTSMEQIMSETSPEGQEAVTALVSQVGEEREAFMEQLTSLLTDVNKRLKLLQDTQGKLESAKHALDEIESELDQIERPQGSLTEKEICLQMAKTLKTRCEEISLAGLENEIELKYEHEKVSQRLDSVKNVLDGIIERCHNTLTDHLKFKEACEELVLWMKQIRDKIPSHEPEELSNPVTLETNVKTFNELRERKPAGVTILEKVKHSAETALKSTAENGKAAIAEEVENLEEELNSLFEEIEATSSDLCHRKEEVEEFQGRYSTLLSWLQGVEEELKEVQLLDTLDAKRQKLERLKSLKAEVAAKEGNITTLVEDSKSKISSERKLSYISDIGARYVALVSNVNDLVDRWSGYVKNHTELNSLATAAKNVNEKVLVKMTELDSVESLYDKKASVDQLVDSKEDEDHFTNLKTQLEQVVKETSAPHKIKLSEETRKIIDDRSELILQLLSLRNTISSKIAVIQELQQRVKQITKQIADVEFDIVDATLYRTTLAEKKAQLEKAKELQKKCKEISLRDLVGKEEVKSDYEALSARLQMSKNKLDELVDTNERAYKEHISFKQACDDLAIWIKKLRDKVPSLSSGGLSDRLSLETSIANFSELQSKRKEGDEKLASVKTVAEEALETSSNDGKKLINNEIGHLENEMNSLFSGIEKTINDLIELQIEFKKFKEQYESVSEWLQSVENDIKQERSVCRGTTLEEKLENQKKCNRLTDELKKGKEEKLDKLSEKEFLLNSHLESYIRNQLKLINSRYEVLVNLLKEVSTKVSEIAENHQNFAKKLEAAQAYIKAANEKLDKISEYDNNRESIEKNLSEIVTLLKRNQDEGQVLVHQAVNSGEKALRSTPIGGQSIISSEMHDVQSKWERYLSRLSEVKVTLETALLHWQDYESTRNKLIKWLDEHEVKLESIKNNSGDSESNKKEHSKIQLRRLNSFLQEVVSYEGMIESNSERTVGRSDAELKARYDTLASNAKDAVDEAQKAIGQLQEFADACSEFTRWLSNAKDKLAKCSFVNDEREALENKAELIKQLSDEEEGLDKLRAAARCCEIAKGVLSPSEGEELDSEIANLQQEYELYKENLVKTKQAYDVAVAKWNEYDEQYLKCLSWLDHIEPIIQDFTKLEPDVITKRTKLEEFQQSYLITIFDWQTEFGLLNVKAQLLLEAYSNSIVSNSFTQLSARYNQLVTAAKDVLHVLEQRYQEHQQQQSLLAECLELTENANERYKELTRPLISSTMDELISRLNVAKSLINTMEQAEEHKVKYLTDLTDKVLNGTHESGRDRIKEDTDNMKKYFTTLMKDINDVKHNLQQQIQDMQEFEKIWKQFTSWLDDEMLVKLNLCEQESDKKSKLNKLKLIDKDIVGHGHLVDEVKAYEGKDPRVSEIMQNKFDPLVDSLAKDIQRLKNEIEDEERYKSLLHEAEKWLQEVKLDLEKCLKGLKDKGVVKKKIEQVKEIKESGNENKVTDLIKLCEESKRSEEEIQRLKFELDVVHDLEKDVESKLEKCLKLWYEFDALYCNLSEWLSRFEIRVNSGKENCKLLLEEGLAKKDSLNEFNSVWDELQSLASPSLAKDELTKLNSLYSTLIYSLQELCAKQSRIKLNEDEFQKAKNDFQQWMDEVRRSLKEPGPNLEETLENLKKLQSTMPEGQVALMLVVESANRLLAECDNPDTVKESLEAMKQDYEDINKEISEAIVDVNNKTARFKEFEKNRQSVEKWLEDNRDAVSIDCENLPHEGDLNKIRAKLDHYKNLIVQVEERKAIVKTLLPEAKEFNMSKEIDELNQSVEEADIICHAIVNNLEDDYAQVQQYYQLLQEIEKWLLQQSFRLMSHHSLNIHNLEQCSKELEKHKAVLEEIESYTSLDELEHKGGLLVDKFHCDKAKIDTQVHNVSDSYDALISQGLRIRDQLQTAKEKYEIYENTLDNCEALLETHKGAELNVNAETLDEAKSEVLRGKSIIEQLNQAKASLQSAVQGCFDATAAVSRPASPEQLLHQQPPVPERETSIKLRIGDLVEHIEHQMLSLNDLIIEKIDCDKNYEAIALWADEKLARLATLESLAHKESLLGNESLFEEEIEEMDKLKVEAKEKLDELVELDTRSKSKPREDLVAKLKKIGDQADAIKSSREQVLREEILNLTNEITSSIEKCCEILDSEEKAKTLKGKVSLLEDAKNVLSTQIENKLDRLKGKQKENIEAKVEDLRKRLKARQQSLEILQGSIDDIKNELFALRSWIFETLQKIIDIDDTSDLAYIRNEVNNKQEGTFAGLKARIDSLEEADEFDVDEVEHLFEEVHSAIDKKEEELKDNQMEEVVDKMTALVADKIDEIERLTNKYNVDKQGKSKSIKNTNQLKELLAIFTEKREELKKQQTLMEDLVGKTKELGKDNDSRITNLNSKWEDLLKEIEDMLALWNTLLRQWDLFLGAELDIRKTLEELNARFEKAEDLDELKEILATVHGLRDKINELMDLSSSSPLVDYLDDTETGRNLEAEQLELIEKINERLDVIEAIFRSISDLKKVLIAIESELIGIDGLIGDAEEEEKLSLFKTEVENCSLELEKLSQDKYKFICEQVHELESLLERVYTLISEKEKEFENAKKLRQEYLSGVEVIMNWIEKAKQIMEESHSDTPEFAKPKMTSLLSELQPTKEMLQRIVVNYGNITKDHSNIKEAELVQTTLRGLGEELDDLDGKLNDRIHSIKMASESWKKFAHMKVMMEKWSAKVRPKITHDTQRPAVDVSLPQTKDKLKELKDMSKEPIPGSDMTSRRCLMEMSQCLARISQHGCSVGPLATEFDEVEHNASQLELKVQQEIALMTELVEEWEQCDEKLKQVRNWIQHCQTSLEETASSGQSAKERLSDREKLLSDIVIQTTKVLLSTEKLSVHLDRLNLIQSPKPSNLLSDLEQLQTSLGKQVRSLSAVVAEEEIEEQKRRQLEQQQFKSLDVTASESSHCPVPAASTCPSHPEGVVTTPAELPVSSNLVFPLNQEPASSSVAADDLFQLPTIAERVLTESLNPSESGSSLCEESTTASDLSLSENGCDIGAVCDPKVEEKKVKKEVTFGEVFVVSASPSETSSKSSDEPIILSEEIRSISRLLDAVDAEKSEISPDVTEHSEDFNEFCSLHYAELQSANQNDTKLVPKSSSSSVVKVRDVIDGGSAHDGTVHLSQRSSQDAQPAHEASPSESDELLTDKVVRESRSVGASRGDVSQSVPADPRVSEGVADLTTFEPLPLSSSQIIASTEDRYAQVDGIVHRNDENDNKCAVKAKDSSCQLSLENLVELGSFENEDESSALTEQTSSESLPTLERDEKDELEMSLHVIEKRLEEVCQSTPDESSVDSLSIHINRILELQHELKKEFERKTLFNKRNARKLRKLFEACQKELIISQTKLDKLRCDSPLSLSMRPHLILPCPREVLPERHTRSQPPSLRQQSERSVYAYVCRAFRASIPLQVLMLLLLGAATLVPTIEDDFSCLLTNNLGSSFDPIVEYPHGPPPI